eukprot:m.152468 g.152468  ORF g.152468 m.152468 type:complete len:151 (+) comp30808_c0_seq2:632-1084(+)
MLHISSELLSCQHQRRQLRQHSSHGWQFTSGFHPWMTARQSIAMSNVTSEDYTLFQFSGACWYFAEGLSMRMREQERLDNAGTTLSHTRALRPLCLSDFISTAIGGSMIEEWTLNTTTTTCTDVSISAHNQMVWDEKVVPYLAMTMKGFL